jgi:hypothetical protein
MENGQMLVAIDVRHGVDSGYRRFNAILFGPTAAAPTLARTPDQRVDETTIVATMRGTRFFTGRCW